MSKILIVDDEPSICWGLQRLAESLGHDVQAASSAEDGLELCVSFRPAAIVLDVRLPGMDGLQAIAEFRQRLGPIPTIVITAYGDLETAVEAVRNGAFEYIVKPFDANTVERALQRALKASPDNADAANAVRAGGPLVGSSAAMQEVFKRIALAAAAEASVLLSGESGTGKELAARAIHQHSARSSGPFVAVNVASLSATLAESELFGHVRGAFTGADEDRQGLLLRADGGTLFLDEVADIPLATQVKLLRALEHGEVVPVGSGTPLTTDFRVVSATHQNLLKLVEEQAFRHDLYYRLGAFRIEIPPLRARVDDIAELVEHFLAQQQAATGTTAQLSAEAIHTLTQRHWPGNVRELRNVIDHALIVTRGGVIEPYHFPDEIPTIRESASMVESIRELISRWSMDELDNNESLGQLYDELLRLVEPPLFAAALAKHHGQCAAAARDLGLHRTTLRKKLDSYDL